MSSMSKLFFGICAGTLLTVSGTASAQERAVIDLGTLGGAWSRPYAVNEKLSIVGSSEIDSPQRYYHAYYWDRITGIIDLGTLGGPQSKSRCITDDNVIVGWATDGVNGYRPMRWEEGTGMVDLGTLGGRAGKCRWINTSGQIVGFAHDADENPRAFLYEEGMGMIDLGTTGGSASEARCINNLGQIVGVANIANEDEHGFYWDPDVGMIELGTFGGRRSAAYSINDHSEVVGDAEKSGGLREAMYWHPDLPEIVKLNGLGGNSSLARGINNAGLIVGRAQNPDLVWHAVIWDRDGNVTDLNTFVDEGSGVFLQSAQCLNQRGYIGAVGRINDESHAFLVTPPLTVSDPIPGEAGRFNTWRIEGALPHSEVYFVYSVRQGIRSVPNCPGVRIAMTRPHTVGPLATPYGTVDVRLWVAGAASGQQVIYQAVERSSCRVSPPGMIRFP